MEEKLQELLNTHLEYIESCEIKRKNLLSRVSFCQAHNFREEERIARLEFEAIDMIVYNYKNMHKEIQELLNGWLS